MLQSGPNSAKKKPGIQYYFSPKLSGTPCDTIPEGFEIWESITGQVLLRRTQERLIEVAEEEWLKAHLPAPTKTHRYHLEVRGATVTIHESETHLSLNALNAASSPWGFAIWSEQTTEERARYQPVLRFVLSKTSPRKFMPERFCFRGSVDDWISIGPRDTIKNLEATYFPHLGQDSFYELF